LHVRLLDKRIRRIRASNHSLRSTEDGTFAVLVRWRELKVGHPFREPSANHGRNPKFWGTQFRVARSNPPFRISVVAGMPGELAKVSVFSAAPLGISS
jgi:hypothetical protein